MEPDASSAPGSPVGRPPQPVSRSQANQSLRVTAPAPATDRLPWCVQSGGATGSLTSARSRLPRLSLFRARAAAAADADGALTPPSRELSATSASSSAAAGSPPGDEAVRVVVRVRPPGARDARAAPAVATRGGREVTLSEPGRAEPFAAAFDAALGAGAGQAEVYATVGAPAVRHCLDGFNATVIAYGQTGSGKTHTVLGDEAALAGGGGGADLDAAGLPPGAGLAPRVFSALFAALGAAAAAGGRHSVRCSLLEIYCEDVLDLLAPGGGPLAVRDGDAARGVYVEGLSEVECSSAAEVLALLARGAAARRSAATAMNDRSSRSHCVLTAAVAATAPPPRGGGLSAVRRSKLNLVDLAGSERVGRSGAKGEALTEARSINRSLAVLGRVAAALGERQRRGSGAGAAAAAAAAGSATDRGGHVPFRDSKLTFLLQESLGGNARTAVVACVAPGADSASETFSTLAFASGARRLRCRPVADEGGAGSPRALTADNARLRRLVAELLAGGGGGDGEAAGGAASPSELRQQLEEQRELFDQNNACLLALRAELADVRRALGAAAGAAGASADEAAALRSDNAALALQAQRAAAALGEASAAAGAAERERDALREERGRVEAAAAAAGTDRDAAVVERIAAVGARDAAVAERAAAFSERAAAFAERDAASAEAAALADELAAANGGLAEARAACEAAAAELADVRAARAAAAAALDEARGEARRAAREARDEAAAAAAREAELRREGAAAAARADALAAEAAAAAARLGREASSRQKYQRMVGEIGRLIDWAQAGPHVGGGAAAPPPGGAPAAARPPPRAAAAKGAASAASPPPALRSWIERV
jgi:hypothetical protein